MSNQDRLTKVADYLTTELFPDTDPLSQSILLGLYRLVATGEPVSLAQLSESVSIDVESVKKRLRSVAPSRFQYDDGGRIVAFAGLSQEPTHHRFLFDGRELFTWCAFDSLFLPQLLGADAQVSSCCPVTDAEIHLTVTADGPRGLVPEGTMMSFVMPDAEKCCGDLRGVFCNHVNFLASPDASRTWQQQNDAAVILTVAEAFHMGQVRNNACFKDALTGVTGQSGNMAAYSAPETK